MLYSQLTHWHSGVEMFSNLEYIQPVRTSKTKNGALNIVDQHDLFMFYRSAGSIQKHIWPNCNDDITFDDTGFNGCIFGVLNLQPGCATPRSAIQGPSGTFVWRFLQARCREEYFSFQYVWCMWGKKYLWPDYFVVVVLVLWKKLEKCENIPYLSCCIR